MDSNTFPPVNPYTNRRPIPKPGEFYGREKETKWLLEQTLGESPQCCAIVGVRRIGKTWLLRFLADPEGARKKYPEYVSAKPTCFLYLDLSTVSSENPVRQVARQAARALSRAVRNGLPLPSSDELARQLKEAARDEDPIQATVEAFQDVAERVGRLVLLLDEVDRREMWRGGVLAPFLRRLASETPTAIVTASARQLHELLGTDEITSPLYNIFWTRFLGMMPTREARQLLVEPARQHGVEWPDQLIKEVLSQTGGHPDLIKLAGAHMWHLWHTEQRPQLTWDRVRDEMWADVEGVFASLERHLKKDERELLRAIARGHPPGLSDYRTLRRLKQYDLIRETLAGWKVFGDLFQEWLQSQPNNEESARLEGPFLRIDGHRVLLTEKERRLVECLLRHRGQVCSREALRREVFEGVSEQSKALEMLVRRLRAKLEREAPGAETHIVTVRGSGYMWK